MRFGPSKITPGLVVNGFVWAPVSAEFWNDVLLRSAIIQDLISWFDGMSFQMDRVILGPIAVEVQTAARGGYFVRVHAPCVRGEDWANRANVNWITLDKYWFKEEGPILQASPES